MEVIIAKYICGSLFGSKHGSSSVHIDRFDFRGIIHVKVDFIALQKIQILPILWSKILINVLVLIANKPRAVFWFCLYLLYAANYIRSSGELISNYFIFLFMVRGHPYATKARFSPFLTPSPSVS